MNLFIFCCQVNNLFILYRIKKMTDANCHKALMLALDYDEKGDKVYNLYTNFYFQMSHFFFWIFRKKQ